MRAPQMASAPPATLRNHPDFLKLWIGQTVSQFGNQFTGLALQLFAVRVLLASPGQMGVLGALGTLPFLLFGLLVGVWVDRHRRRPILIAGDFGRDGIRRRLVLLFRRPHGPHSKARDDAGRVRAAFGPEGDP